MFSFDEDQSPAYYQATSSFGLDDLDDLSDGDSGEEGEGAGGGEEEGSLDARRHQRRALMSRKIVSGRPPRSRRGVGSHGAPPPAPRGGGGGHTGMDDLDMGSLSLRDGALAPAAATASMSSSLGGTTPASEFRMERQVARVAQSGGSFGSEDSYGGSFDQVAASSSAPTASPPGGVHLQQPLFAFMATPAQQQLQQQQFALPSSPPVVPSAHDGSGQAALNMDMDS